MRNIRLVLEYDGTEFSGWQAQAIPGVRTVQEAVEAVLAQVLREPVRLAVAGRTDSGCHAAGQTANFRTAHAISLHRLARALSGLLPADIAGRSVAVVREACHARDSAVERRYHYLLLDRPSALWARRAWWPFMRLHPGPLSECFAPFLGEHDFRAFAGRDPARGDLPHGRCRVTRLAFVRWEEGVRLAVHANRFLYHMVRNLVGTATAITKGTRRGTDLPAILASHERRAAGPTAPAVGLSLVEVVYPEHHAALPPVVDGWGRELA